MPTHSFGQPIRLAYIEARLFLDGEFYSKKLMQLGFSRVQASIDIKEFLRINGKVMFYCATRKRYILDRRFKPRLLKREQHASFAMHVESIYLLAYRPIYKA